MPPGPRGGNEKALRWCSAEPPQPRSDPRFSRGPPGVERAPDHDAQPWAGPFESPHWARGPRFRLSHDKGACQGRTGDGGFVRECPSRRGAPAAGRRGAGGRRTAPAPPLAGAPAPRRGLRVPTSTPPSRPRPRSLRRTRAASLRAAGGGGRGRGRGRGAPNLSDPQSRPGAAGAAGERSAPLSRGFGPSCATRTHRACRGRGDERRPRGGAPGWGGARGGAIENWRSGEVGAAGRPAACPEPSRTAPRPARGLCDGRIRRVEAPEIPAEEG